MTENLPLKFPQTFDSTDDATGANFDKNHFSYERLLFDLVLDFNDEVSFLYTFKTIHIENSLHHHRQSFRGVGIFVKDYCGYPKFFLNLKIF